jgi:hypothetical protein
MKRGGRKGKGFAQRTAERGKRLRGRTEPNFPNERNFLGGKILTGRRSFE